MNRKTTGTLASFILIALIISYLGYKSNASIQATEEDTSFAFRNYNEARPVFWEKLYPDGGETLYCAESFKGGYNRGINIEHVFPMSWVAWKLKCGERRECRNNSDEFNLIEADLHNLYPARADINETRSSHAFAMIKGEKRKFGQCDFEIDYNKRIVEPRKEVRGEIARAMLYMADRYDLYLKKKLRVLLLKWHREDPPNAEEKLRNVIIEQIQGSGNHWINRNN